jgi:hypothetical protein
VWAIGVALAEPGRFHHVITQPIAVSASVTTRYITGTDWLLPVRYILNIDILKGRHQVFISTSPKWKVTYVIFTAKPLGV